MNAFTNVELLEDRRLLSTSLVADVTGIFPKSAVELNGVSYFLANDSTHGQELWRSDGTEAGTRIVADINVGAGGSSIPDMFREGGRFYFIRNDYGNGSVGEAYSLWTTDGTSAGTVQLAVLATHSKSSFFQHASLNGKLILTTGESDDDLGHVWVSDGTVDGTVDIATTGAKEVGGSPTLIFSTGDRVVFLVRNAELWTTDGTSQGTQRLTESTGLQFTVDSYNALQLANSGAVYFRVSGSNAIWKTDGTSAGTQVLFSNNNSFRDFFYSGQTQFFFFTADDTGQNTELWRTDGTQAGTVKLTTFDSVTVTGTAFIGDTWYFSNASTSIDVWKSDGTVAGTKVIGSMPRDGWSRAWVVAGGKIFFGVENGDRSSRLLWEVDPADDSIRVIRDITHETDMGSDFLSDVDGQLAITTDTGTILIDPATGAEPLQPAQARVKFQNGVVYIFGSTGNDQIRVYRMIQDPTKLIVAINGKIWKLNFADVTRINIYGYSGNDSIAVKEAFGRITIRSRIWGGDGNDTVITGSGRDTVYGETGNDDIMTGTNDDIAMGGLGNDDINTSYGNDTIDGDEGSDTLYAGAGNDLLSGGDDASHDRLDGGIGADVIFGHSVIDIFYSGQNMADPSGLDSVLIET